LRHEDAFEPHRDDEVEVGIGRRRIVAEAVDPDIDLAARTARLQEGADVGARLVLAPWRDRILEIDDDAVGARPHGLGEHLRPVAGNVEQRTARFHGRAPSVILASPTTMPPLPSRTNSGLTSIEARRGAARARSPMRTAARASASTS